MPKRTGLSLFIDERQSGVPKAELRSHYIGEWNQLPQKEKDRYNEMATMYNAQYARGKEARHRKQNPAQVAPVDSNLEKPHKTNREYVLDLFTKSEWTTQPIVVCTFTTYLDPKYENIYFPAEVGLATFTLKDGIIDNFGRVIDPGKPPVGYRVQVKNIIRGLGVPYPGSNSDFADMKSLMLILESYLDKYRGQLAPGEFYVFALDDEIELVTRCFQRLGRDTGRNFPIRVLSLSLFAHLASANSQVGMQKVDEPSSLLPHLSKHRQFGKPLTYCFYYSRAHPMTKYGLFNSEKEVTDSLRRVKGYKDFQQLCCIYHFQNRTGIALCALNEANRHAFHILEVLTLSNEIEIIPGHHYPQLRDEKRQMDIDRRHGWIANWGIAPAEIKSETLPPDVTMAEAQPQGESRPTTGEAGSKKSCPSSHVAAEEEPANPDLGEPEAPSDDSPSQSRWFRHGFTQSLLIDDQVQVQGPSHCEYQAHEDALKATVSPAIAHVRGRIYDIFDGPTPGVDVSTGPSATACLDLGDDGDDDDDSHSQSRWFRHGSTWQPQLTNAQAQVQGPSDCEQQAYCDDLGASATPAIAHVRGKIYDIFDGPIAGLDVSTAPTVTARFDLGTDDSDAANADDEGEDESDDEVSSTTM